MPSRVKDGIQQAKFNTYKLVQALDTIESVIDLVDDPSPRKAKRAMANLKKLTG